MPTAASASLPYSGFVFGRRLRPWGSVKMENPLARTSVTVSPRMPFASSASWMLMKRSTILNMWTLLHWLSEVSSPSSGISRFASSTSGVSHGSLKSAVVLKSKVCLRRMGAVEHPAAMTASAPRTINRCMASLRPAIEQGPCQTAGTIPSTICSPSIPARVASQSFSSRAARFARPTRCGGPSACSSRRASSSPRAWRRPTARRARRCSAARCVRWAPTFSTSRMTSPRRCWPPASARSASPTT